MFLFYLPCTCPCLSPVAPRLWSDGQFDTQSLAIVMAGVIDRGVHHIIDGVHQTGHVLW